MNADIPLPIAHYVRSSSTEAHSPFSIEAQRHVLTEYSAKCFGPSWALHEVYEDRASGLTLDRPDLRRMLLDARKRLFGHVLVHRMDRLSRKPAHMAFVLRELSSNGVAVRSTSEPFDLSAASGRLVSQMIGIFAEFEVRQKRERTMMGRAQRVRSGGYFGSYAPYGYDLAPGMRLVVNEKEAGVVRRIFALYLEEGLGSTNIASRLAEEGCTARKGGRWQPGSVHDVLRSPLSAGLVRIYGVCYQGTHEPIISIGDFQRAQDVMNERSKALGFPGRGPPRRHLLRGILKCGLCGRSMYAAKGGSRNRKNDPVYYACSGRMTGTGCGQDSLYATVLESAAAAEVAGFLHDESTMRTAWAAASALLARAREAHQKELARLYKQRTKARLTLDRYVETGERGIGIPDVVRGRIERWHGKLQEVEGKIEPMQRIRDGLVLPPFDPKFMRRHLKDFEDALMGDDSDLSNRRMRKFVREIVVHRKSRIDMTLRLPVPRGVGLLRIDIGLDRRGQPRMRETREPAEVLLACSFHPPQGSESEGRQCIELSVSLGDETIGRDRIARVVEGSAPLAFFLEWCRNPRRRVNRFVSELKGRSRT